VNAAGITLMLCAALAATEADATTTACGSPAARIVSFEPGPEGTVCG
jgi:hypothetical protein